VPHARFLKLDVGRRDRLLEAAAEEFAARGYDRASLNKVIAKLGLSKGQFYYYFDNKADLFATVLERTWQRVAPDTELDFSHLDAHTFWPALERMADRSLDAIRTMPWYIGVMRHLIDPPADPAVRRLVARKLDIARRARLSLVRRGQALGCVRRDLPDDLLLAIIFAVRNAVDRWYVDYADAFPVRKREALSRRLFALFRRLLEPEPRVRGTRRDGDA
jgi:AcrR family transcriptional regulator